MHGPGGYNKYLAAIWANDQAEYINPFFPFLGNSAGNESALNSFRHFSKKIPAFHDKKPPDYLTSFIKGFTSVSDGIFKSDFTHYRCIIF